MMDDAELLRDYAVTNSEAAFRTLVERHSGLVWSAALRQARNREMAEDITQAVFVILAKKAPQLTGKTVLVGWLYRATRFASIQALRNEARRIRRERNAAALAENETQQDSTWEHIAPKVDAALMKLRNKDREAILLRYFDNRSLREVGTSLGCTEEAAKKRITRALKRLRVLVGDTGGGLSVLGIAALISSRAVQAAPPGLISSACAVSLTKGATGATAVLALVKQTMKAMFITKTQLGIGALVSTLLLTGIVVSRSAPAGAVDLSFNSQFQADSLKDLAIQSDGKVLFVGPFYFGVTNGGNSVLYAGVGRVAMNGAVDGTFRPAPVNSGAEALAVQPDGKLLLGGAAADRADLKLSNIQRLNEDGSVDTAFDHHHQSDYSEGAVWKVLLQPDLKILMAGSFGTVQGQTNRGLARLNPDGSVDASFHAATSPGENVSHLLIQNDGKILMRSYVLFQQNGNTSSRERGLVRLQSDGSFDPAFQPPQFTQPPIAFDPDGRLLATVRPAQITATVLSIVRLNSDGSLDPSFNATISTTKPKTRPALGALLVQPDHRILLAGDFDQVDDQPRNNVARLNPDGTLDTSFDLGAGLEAFEYNGQGQLVPGHPQVSSIRLQTDGNILIAGHFSKINGVPCYGLARLWGKSQLSFVTAAISSQDLFKCVISGAEAKSLRIETSANLRDWAELGTVTNDAGAFLYTSSAKAQGTRFYRAVSE